MAVVGDEEGASARVLTAAVLGVDVELSVEVVDERGARSTLPVVVGFDRLARHDTREGKRGEVEEAVRAEQDRTRARASVDVARRVGDLKL